METKATSFEKNALLRKKRRTKIALVVVVVAIITIVAMVAVLRKKEFHIQGVVVSGTRALDPKEIISSMKQFTAGSWLGVIPKTSTILFSKQQATLFLEKSIPSIQETSFHFSTGNILQVVVREKEPKFLWCNDQTCYFVDDQGVIYKESLIFSPGVFFTFQGSSLPMPDSVIGSSFITLEQFNYVMQVVAALKKLSIIVSKATFEENGDISFTISSINNIATAQTSRILLTWNASLSDITASLELLFENETFKKTLVQRGASLETVDVRFPGKIYYTFLP